jgi:hypothetical protein
MTKAIIRQTMLHDGSVLYYKARSEGYTHLIKEAHQFELEQAKEYVETDLRAHYGSRKIEVLVRKKKHEGCNHSNNV